MKKIVLSACFILSTGSMSALPSLAAPQTKKQSSIQWQSYEQALLQAKQLKRPVYLQFHANWCGYCKKLTQESYSQKVIQNLLNQQFVPVQIVEDSKATYTVQGKTYTAQDLILEYKVSGFPTLAFLEPDGKLIGLVPGYVKPNEFQLLLAFISSKAYLKTDFDTYSKTQK